jgi:hypothetical protein
MSCCPVLEAPFISLAMGRDEVWPRISIFRGIQTSVRAPGELAASPTLNARKYSVTISSIRRDISLTFNCE